VHLTWLGHPIIGDLIYGGEPLGEPEFANPQKPAGGQECLTYARNKEEGKKMWDKLMAREDMLIRRPALHAAVLQFAHPIDGQTMTFTAPLYDDMRYVLNRLRDERPGPHEKPLPAKGAQVDMAQLGANSHADTTDTKKE
jgi:23S rRNA pseudouridine1911/1915/1917 synthase